jgi:hypothetical protein
MITEHVRRRYYPGLTDAEITARRELVRRAAQRRLARLIARQQRWQWPSKSLELITTEMYEQLEAKRVGAAGADPGSSGKR